MLVVFGGGGGWERGCVEFVGSREEGGGGVGGWVGGGLGDACLFGWVGGWVGGWMSK